MNNGFRDVKKWVNKGSFAWMSVSEDNKGCVLEFVLSNWLVEKLIPHKFAWYKIYIQNYNYLFCY